MRTINNTVHGTWMLLQIHCMLTKRTSLVVSKTPCIDITSLTWHFLAISNRHLFALFQLIQYMQFLYACINPIPPEINFHLGQNSPLRSINLMLKTKGISKTKFFSCLQITGSRNAVHFMYMGAFYTFLVSLNQCLPYRVASDRDPIRQERV